MFQKKWISIYSEKDFLIDALRNCDLRAPLFIGFRRLFASGQILIGKISGGYLQVATLKSSCIVLFARLLKNHPIELIEIPLKKSVNRFNIHVQPPKIKCRKVIGAYKAYQVIRYAEPYLSAGSSSQSLYIFFPPGQRQVL